MTTIGRVTLCALVTLVAASCPSADVSTSPLALQKPVPASGISEGYFPAADGVRLFYRKVGNGKTVVVCLHGGPGLNIASGCLDAEPLARGRTLLMYDQRGSGRSQLVSEPKRLTARDHVRDLEALRQHFGIERLTLIGFSWGAGLAAMYAMEHLERVERLILVAPLPPARTPYWPQRLAKVAGKLGPDVAARVDEIRQRLPYASDRETLDLCHELRVGYRAYLANPADVSRVRDRCDVPPASIRNGITVARVTIDSLGDWDFRPGLSRVTVPALVVEGAETEVPLEATREWVAVMPRARLLLIPGAGHELWAEQPEAFLSAAEQFVSGESTERAKVRGADRLALGSCEDTNLNLFLSTAHARQFVPDTIGTPAVTPLFGGETTPLNVAHFRCAAASIGGRPAAALNFALVRVPLHPEGHLVLWVLTDSSQLRDALRSHGIDSAHVVSEASLHIEGATWATSWAGDYSPYSVVAHQATRLAAPSGRIDWIFRGSHGIIHITGSHALYEEFADRNPVVDVPAASALRPFLDRARGITAMTHRNSLDLSLNPPQ